MFQFSAIFGVRPRAAPTPGLPTLALGINRITQCTVSPNMPTTTTRGANTFVAVGDAVYSFGGILISPSSDGSKEVFRYDMNTVSWTRTSDMIQARYSPRSDLVSDNEIFITGIQNVL